MTISILTLFPTMFSGPFDESIVGRAIKDGKVTVNYINIRDFGIGNHHMVDDRPFGGGVGMVMRIDVLAPAIEYARNLIPNVSTKVVLMDPRGRTFTQEIAHEYKSIDHLILLCGHYEGVDERVRALIDDTISIGDFITTGGEIPAMLIIDAITRLLPGVLEADATDLESFSLMKDGEKYLEYPQYTQPREYCGDSVPEILLSGNHKAINEWRLRQAKEITTKIRPDLLCH